MRIPLQIVNGLLRVTVIMKALKYRIGQARMWAVVDTGSPVTFMSEGDAKKNTNIPIGRFEYKKNITLGGATFKLFEMVDVTIGFMNDEGQLEKIKVPSFFVGKSTQTTKKGILESLNTPSIIGTDFLKDYKLALYFNPYKNVAYLERVEE